jgi:hypothetical protein
MGYWSPLDPLKSGRQNEPIVYKKLIIKLLLPLNLTVHLLVQGENKELEKQN